MRYLFVVMIAGFFFSAKAQTIVRKDAAIENMVAQLNSDSLRSYIREMVAFGTRSTMSNQTSKKTGIGASREWVLQKFNSFSKNSNGRLSAIIDTTIYAADKKRVDRNIILGNVVATLKGTDKNDKRIFIISGHLDSRRINIMDSTNLAPGANDDGSGVAAVLECARVMSSKSSSATIIFVAVSGEEQGLLGSTYMANKAKAENWNIAAVLNNDIMGSNNSSGTNIIDNTRLRVFSEGLSFYNMDKKAKQTRQLGLENDGDSRQLARYVKEVGERYVPNLEVVMVYRPDRFLRGGDHIPYQENGFNAVRITEMNENFNHQHQDVRVENGIQYGDLQEFMDFEYLRKNTAVNLATLANLAAAPSQPQEVKIEVSNLSNSTSLKWKAPLVGIASGYYVMMRETTSAVWQKKIYTTDTFVELPYSKDNYFFAVQSVNEAGNESLPIIPAVAR